jgi:hypothetical protein
MIEATASTKINVIYNTLSKFVMMRTVKRIVAKRGIQPHENSDLVVSFLRKRLVFFSHMTFARENDVKTKDLIKKLNKKQEIILKRN